MERDVGPSIGLLQQFGQVARVLSAARRSARTGRAGGAQ